jgi:integrase
MEKEQNKATVQWNGRDFRGEKLCPKYTRFIREHPKVFEWLEGKPKNTMQNGCHALTGLCEFSRLTPEQFLKLDEKTARDKAWKYLSSFKIKQPAKALNHKAYIQSFYYWHREKKLPFIRGKHDIVYEPMRIKMRMSKDVCWKIIRNGAINLRDKTILTFDFESGLRRNAIAHLNFGHYKNPEFKWFKKTEDGEVIKSNEREGNIAIFKVMATPTKEYTYDKKLRGKNINGYLACLHKEATKILKEYVAQYHQDSKDDTPLWYSLNPLNKNMRLSAKGIYRMVKTCIERARLPTDQINFHSFRRGFRSVLRNTSTITDNELKESLMGHRLKGSQEYYFYRDPLESAREYAKCDFSEPHPEKDRALAEKDKEIERLTEESRKVKEAMEKAKVTTKVEIEPMPTLEPPHDMTPETMEKYHIHSASPELNKTFNEFNEVLEMREQYEKDVAKTQQPKSEQAPPTKTSKNATSQTWCPFTEEWIDKSECSKCAKENFKRYSECYASRNRIRLGKATEQDLALFNKI